MHVMFAFGEGDQQRVEWRLAHLCGIDLLSVVVERWPASMVLNRQIDAATATTCRIAKRRLPQEPDCLSTSCTGY